MATITVAKPINQVIQFRLLQMPCCNTLICWVNPRRPMYCVECGTRVFHAYPRGKWDTIQSPATLRIEDETAAFYPPDPAFYSKKVP